ncbi:peptidase family M48-domain-containing protein [Hyaloraphidium curvatum]|nr:peptidase family M48-domain-containing protein [Hyaloraphidium curvatum]
MGWGKWLVVAWAGGTTVYYFTHQDRVPISGRKRFLSVTPEEEIFMARVSLQQVLQEYGSKIVPPNHPIHQFVAGVVKRLLPVTGLTDLEWEIRVIADPQQNAFVLPGGKIFVFTGILDVCPDADSLATVLGHEMAHTIARHSAEKLSYAQLFTWTLVAAHWILGIDLTWVQGLIYNFAVNLPRSRMVESEADYIGLQLMAQACFDPSKAVGVWQRFILKQPPEFLSDHPSHESRIVTLQKWLPEAQMRSEQSDCHRTLDFLGAFGGAWGYEPRRGSHAPQKIIGFEDQVLDPSHLVRTDEAVREAYDSFSNGEGEGRRR